MHKLLITILVMTLFLVGCAKTNFNVPDQSERDVEIGVLFRQEFSDDVCGHRRYRHIQILLDGNEIMGYNIGVFPTPFFLKYMFFNVQAEVREYPDLQDDRMHYINIEAAKNAEHHGKTGQHIVTDFVKIKVTREQADRLRENWYDLRDNPPDFKLVGRNCATRLYEMFAKTGILPSGGLSGLDRPEGVYELLEKYYPDMTLEVGYFEIDAQRNIRIEPVADICDRCSVK